MADIDAYSSSDDYMKFQSQRPDYTRAISTSLELAEKYTKDKKDLVVTDFCCGTGSNTRSFALRKDGITGVILIDINKGFIETAKKSGIMAKKVKTICDDILKANLDNEADLVFSIFAYHHVPDDVKMLYVKKIKEALKKDGIVILTEIYLSGAKQNIDYYNKLYTDIPNGNIIKGLKEFLEQTARSHDFEFKVKKSFAEEQFLKEGFVKIAEQKIYPSDDSFGKDAGTFVQVFKLK